MANKARNNRVNLIELLPLMQASVLTATLGTCRQAVLPLISFPIIGRAVAAGESE
jgi:hypothetical protein